MRKFSAVFAVLGLLATHAAHASAPNRVVYVLGGVMSGPYRIEGDLVTGELAEADTPPGALGDRAGIDALTLPVTKRWTLPPDRLARLRVLTAKVWRGGGMEQLAVSHTRHPRKGPPVVWLTWCTPSMDALGSLTLEQGGRKKTFEFSMPCLSRTGHALLDGLTAPK